MTHTARIWWGVIGLCLAAFMAIAILSAQIFEHTPHSEDEVAYVFQARVFAQNRLSVPTPPLDKAFWSPFVVDYQGRRFGKYPPGWPLLLSLGVRLNAPWIVNAVLAVFTLAMIGWLGYGYYCGPDKDTGCYVSLIAVGLGLVTPGFLFLSSSLLSHPASLFWATLALAALYCLTTTHNAYYIIRNSPLRSTQYAIWPQSIYAILLGVSLGAAFLTRPFAAVGIGLAIGIFLLVLIIRGELKRIVLLWIILGGLPVAVLLPLYWWAITGDPTFNAYLLVWPYDRIGFGPDVGPYGYTLHNAIFINTKLKLTTLATGLFGWPGWASLIFLPIIFMVRRAARWDWLLLGVIVSLIVIHNFYWAFGGVDGGFPRYYYDALPAFLLLTARGIQASFQYLRRKELALPFQNKKVEKLQISWLLVVVIIYFIGYNFVWNLPPLLAAQKGKYNITPAPLQVVERAGLSEPALILVKDVESWSDFAAPFTANSPTLDGPIVYAIDWGPKSTQRLRQHFEERTCWELQGVTLKPCPLTQ